LDTECLQVFEEVRMFLYERLHDLNC